MPVETTFVELELEEGGAIEIAPDPDEPGGFTLLAQEPDGSEDDGEELVNAAELFLTREELAAVGAACLRVAGQGGHVPIVRGAVAHAMHHPTKDGKKLETMTLAIGPDRSTLHGFVLTPEELTELAGQIALVLVRWDLQPAGPYAVVPQAGAR